MKLVFGKTPEEIEAEEAMKQREIEAQVQQAMFERQSRIEALHKKQKSNKIIVLTFTTIIVIALLVFGTYNTFFKKELTTTDISNQITKQTSSLTYPSEGLDNYIRDNSQGFFNKYASVADDTKYDYAKVDKNSVNISKVIKLSNSLSLVYFSADVEVKSSDTKITDPAIIEQLKKNGFGIKSAVKEEDVTTNDEVDTETEEETTEQPVTEDAEVEDTEETTEAVQIMDANAEVEEATTEEIVEEDPGFSTTNLDVAYNDNSETVEYYMLENGTIMQRGSITTMRYKFSIPIEFYYTYKDPETKKEPLANGYRPAGEMTLYSLVDIDLAATDEIEVHPYLQFNQDEKYEDSEIESAKIRVDKIFNEIYSGINTDHELKLSKQFNTYDATYVGMINFEIYKTPNQLGYNAHVTYKIQLPQGITYVVEDYLIVEKDGGSWVITSIL